GGAAMTHAITIPKSPAELPAAVNRLRKHLNQTDDPAVLVRLVSAFDQIEDMMSRAGYRKNTEAMRPTNEARFEARWKLGRLLAKLERAQGPGRGKKMSRAGTSFRTYLAGIALDKNRANEAERIGAMPPKVQRKAFDEAGRLGVLNTGVAMPEWARPHYKLHARAKKHRQIRDAVVELQAPAQFGPFPLIYADPPWRFETFTPAGGGRSPDQ